MEPSVNIEELRENRRYFGWIMLASILTDEWNIFLIPQTNLFIENIYRLSSLELGIITGIVILGAAVGSLLGGIFTDLFGRKKVFQIDMGLFIFSAIFSILSYDVFLLMISRLIAGIVVGADIANVYAYIMETEEPGKREYIGSLGPLIASFSILSINGIVLVLLLLKGSSLLIWDLSLLFSCIPATVSLALSHGIKESIPWKSESNKNISFKKMFQKIRSKDKLRNTSIYSYISGVATTIEVGTFAFFIPFIVSKTGIYNEIQVRLIVLSIYAVGIPAGFTGARLVSRLGFKRITCYGYLMTLIALFFSAIFLIYQFYYIVPVTMMIFVWGNHWNSQPIIPSQAIVSNTEFRGKSIGITNFISEVPAFLSISIFPSFVNYVGLGISTIVICIAPIFGLMASLFIYKEIYGHTTDINTFKINN